MLKGIPKMTAHNFLNMPQSRAQRVLKVKHILFKQE